MYKHNGLAEKKHRDIIEHGITLLAHASMPLKCWDEAYRTAVYLSNRVPNFFLENKSPLHLKTFGCACYPNI